MSFTAASISALKPPATRTLFYDDKAPAFGLKVSPKGTKTYFMTYGPREKRRQVAIGRHGNGQGGTITLGQARDKFKSLRGKVADGESPAEERAAIRNAGTVADLAQVYLDEHAAKKKSGHKDRQILKTYVNPEIGHISLADIRRSDVALLLRKIEADGKPVARNRTLEVVRAMFNFALDDELERFPILDGNPAARVKKLDEAGREVWLRPEQIGPYWLAVEALPEPVRSCLKLVILTAQRQHQVLEMRWQDISLQSGIWKVPAARTKGGRPQQLPLTPTMVKILGSLKSKSPWVFPGRGTEDAAGWTYIYKPHNKIRTALGIENFRLHDWRHTFTSLAGPKAGRAACSLVLGHANDGALDDRSSTDGYDHAEYVEPRARALEAWEKIVQTAANAARGDNVVALV
jgi:integrase